jgi:hypothetical protein
MEPTGMRSRKDKTSMFRSLTWATLLGCVVLAVVGCNSAEEQAAWEHLSGVWETPVDMYAGSSLEFNSEIEILAIGDVEGGVTIHRVTSIRQDRQDHQLLYHIEYRSEEGLEYLISLLCSVEDGEPVLRRKNQTQIPWYRTDTSPRP